jgi:hypothetical protein
MFTDQVRRRGRRPDRSLISPEGEPNGGICKIPLGTEGPYRVGGAENGGETPRRAGLQLPVRNGQVPNSGTVVLSDGSFGDVLAKVAVLPINPSNPFVLSPCRTPLPKWRVPVACGRVESGQLDEENDLEKLAGEPTRGDLQKLVPVVGKAAVAFTTEEGGRRKVINGLHVSERLAAACGRTEGDVRALAAPVKCLAGMRRQETSEAASAKFRDLLNFADMILTQRITSPIIVLPKTY